MEIYSPKLFIEINKSEYIFAVGDENENEKFYLIYKNLVSIKGIDSSRISDFDLAFNTIKENILLIEQKLNFTFKETIIILDNFNPSFINLTGFKKLNGSQILIENITYILNSLKSNIDKLENKKTILHIFNSKYVLDKKKIKNLPIGLFGDFYSHELSFCLIDNNDNKNLHKIFEKCNLNIKKILLKSFVESSIISNKNLKCDTFFKIQINNNDSKILYFENDALKLEQSFNFGSGIVIRDVAKITSLSESIIKKILANTFLSQEIIKEELIEKELFENNNYRKIKKKLIFEIADARIKELSELIFLKNINFASYANKNQLIFLNIEDKSNFEFLKENYSLFFSANNFHSIKIIENCTIEDNIKNAYEIAYFGWKQEAIPVVQSKKSLIARFFDVLFG